MLRNYVSKVNKLTRSPLAGFKRTLMETGLKKPSIEKTNLTVHTKPSSNSSTSINNGTKGQQLFPRGTFFKTLNKELPKAAESLLAISGLMFIWPYMVIKSSNFINSVPSQTTAAVTRVNGELSVDIPQTYVGLDIVSDDE